MQTNQVVYIVEEAQLEFEPNKSFKNLKNLSNKNRDKEISNQAQQINSQNPGEKGKSLLLKSLAETIEKLGKGNEREEDDCWNGALSIVTAMSKRTSNNISRTKKKRKKENLWQQSQPGSEVEPDQKKGKLIITGQSIGYKAQVNCTSRIFTEEQIAAHRIGNRAVKKRRARIKADKEPLQIPSSTPQVQKEPVQAPATAILSNTSSSSRVTRSSSLMKLKLRYQ
jgi:hypothetical protein